MNNLIQNAIAKIDVKTAVEQFLDNLDKDNYSECAKLLENKHLGSFGYTVGSLLKNYFETKQISIKADNKVKLIIVELGKTVVSLEQESSDSLKNFDDSNKSFITEINDQFKKQLEPVFELMINLMKSCENQSTLQCKINLLTHYIDACSNNNMYLIKLAESTLFNNKLFQSYSDNHKEIVSCLFKSLVEINKQDTNVLNNMINSSKDVLLAYINKDKHSSEKISTSSEISSGETLDSNI